MSIAIINATISGTLVVGGTSTLTGALTSGSTLNAQGITSTTLNLTNNLVQTGTGNLASGTGGISCNANLVVSGNTIINSNCNVLGNINLSRDLVAGATTITNTQLGFISGLTSNAQTQITAVIPTLLAQTNAWTALNTYNTVIPTTTISATTANQFCNKTYTDTADTTTITNLRAGANTWTGINTYNTSVNVFNVLPTSSVNATTTQQLTNKSTVDSLITTNNTLLFGSNNSWNGTTTFGGSVNFNTTSFFNTLPPQTSILPTTNTMCTNKLYVDASFTTLRGATNSWTGVNTFNNNVVLPTATYLVDSALFLRGVGDVNHKLQYNVTSDGPALQGLSGGRLGITTNPTILTWNSTTIDMNVRTSFNNEIRMNSNPFYLKSVGDNNHVLRYEGVVDGPSLIGALGGRLGTIVKNDILTWNTTAGINSVNVSGNTNLTGNVNILPYAPATILSAHTLNCQAITSLGQIVAGGVGIVTAKLQCSNNGTGILGLQCGSYQASTNANQVVAFPNTFLGSNNPIVFLQPVYASATTGTAYVISTSLTSFTYRFFFDGSVNSESAVLMYWHAYQV